MAEGKLFAGHAVRRVRRRLALTQAAMAEALGVSPSYLNLVERNQRPLSATLLMRLAEQYDVHPRDLAAGEPGGGEAAIRRRLADPLFADLEVDRGEVAEWLAAAPGGAEAFARAYDRGGDGAAPVAGDDPGVAVRREIERWRGHFADLDAAAEGLADDLRQQSGDLFAALAERLRVKHQLSIRVLPVEVMAAGTRLDLHARQLQLSETLDPASRTFALAQEVARQEARGQIDALVAGAGFGAPVAERLYRRHLSGYFAAAVTMPYARFLRACEATGYDLELIRRRFGASVEQVAHRLTTLGRVGARGLPFFMLRLDRAGQVSKRFAGASGSALVEGPGLCPLLGAFDAFQRPDERIVQLVELEDGTRWFTSSRCVGPAGGWSGGLRARFVVTLGLAAEAAGGLAAARGLELAGAAVPVGLGCRACTRVECPQRSAAPAGRVRLGAGFAFAGD